MKYPNTPEYLENAPASIVELYRDLEEYTIRDICRRLKWSGEMTNSAIEQIRALKRRGIDQSKIEAAIKATLQISDKEFDEAFDRAIERNKQYYEETLTAAGLLAISTASDPLLREFEAIRAQTHDEFKNISQSLGFAMPGSDGKIQFYPIAEAYQKALDDAELKLLSGVTDYNTAIRDSVKELTRSGLQYVEYASGWHNRVDVAARRAVMTGITQMANRYSEDTADRLETDLVEVTAHVGARNKGEGYVNHNAWQGKVYSRSGKHPKYPSLVEVTGYGKGGGLAGWNCRHSMFAFVEGVSERTYTDKELRNIDPEPIEYQGKTYDAYECTQMQRKLETAIRQAKRDIAGAESAGLKQDANDAKVKLARLQNEYTKFSNAAGLKEKENRLIVRYNGRRKNN